MWRIYITLKVPVLREGLRLLYPEKPNQYRWPTINWAKYCKYSAWKTTSYMQIQSIYVQCLIFKYLKRSLLNQKRIHRYSKGTWVTFQKLSGCVWQKKHTMPVAEFFFISIVIMGSHHKIKWVKISHRTTTFFTTKLLILLKKQSGQFIGSNTFRTLVAIYLKSAHLIFRP